MEYLFMGGERPFYSKPVKNLASYLFRKSFLQKEKNKCKKSRCCSSFYLSIMPTTSKFNTKLMEYHCPILREVG